MEHPRRSFTEDYKRQVVELLVSSRRSITSMVKELGLRGSVLRRSVDKLRQEPASAAWLLTAQTTPMSAGRTFSPSAKLLGIRLDTPWRPDLSFLARVVDNFEVKAA